MTSQQLALDVGAPDVASVRKRDPRTAKAAAAHDAHGRNLQRVLILRLLVDEMYATADDAARVIDRHRSVASTRLNVLRRNGWAEKCGVTPKADEYGRVRDVDLWRATPAGRVWLEEQA